MTDFAEIRRRSENHRCLDCDIGDDMADEIARLRAENANLDERMRNWMRIADERAVHVGTLKVERDRLRAALHWIERHYANQDMNHVDYRVEAYSRALEALDVEQGASE